MVVGDKSKFAIDMPRLPVPVIREEPVHHIHKQSRPREDSNRLRPPKIKPVFNRSHTLTSSTAQAISFRGENNDFSVAETLSLMTSYNSSASESYFEQCFTRLAKIGEGSFGEVYKVRSKEDGLLYAVKMSKQMFRSENYRMERLQEVRRYEQFSGHENCIRFYRAWEQDDRLYMQMELCRESLERYLWLRKHIPEERIWSILLDLLLALKNLHDRNLLHLDIKLENVLMDFDDTCKLADFGLVVDVERANKHEATEGDSRYMAPEIMQGKFSKAADIFSLGIAMLELSCYLELPSNGPLWQQLRNGILPEEFIKNISVDLQNMIRDMMTPNPMTRPTVDQLLNHKKLMELTRQRSHWGILRRMQRTFRKSRRLLWTKVCNLRNAAIQIFTSFVDNFRQHKPITDTPKQRKIVMTALRAQIVGSTPVIRNGQSGGSEFFTDEIGFDVSQNGTPSNFALDNNIINSTPVIQKPRNDRFNSSFKGVDNVHEFSLLDEDSFVRKPLDTSSMRRKKLFALDNDD